MNLKYRYTAICALAAIIASVSHAKKDEKYTGTCEQAATGTPLSEKEKVLAELRRVEPMLSVSDKGLSVEWSGIEKDVRARSRALGESESRLTNLTISIWQDGVEIEQGLKWGTTSRTYKKVPFAQSHFYVEYKRGNKVVHRSSFGLMESTDGQQIEKRSFDKRYQGELLGVKYDSSLQEEMPSSKLTDSAVNLSYNKIVWVLKPDASQRVREVIQRADKGVDVYAHFGVDGAPTHVEVTDRATGARHAALPEDFFFKVDAAFSGHSFFWDDMIVALSTAAHHPWLVRSTLEFWLMVQERNDGVIPREVLKSNLRSLFFPDKIVYGEEKAQANLVYTNPYLMNWVMNELYKYHPSKENFALLKRVYKSVESYAKWMEERRAVTHNGQIIGFNGSALGTGADNSRGRIGNRNEPDAYNSGLVDFMAQQIQMYKDLAHWGKIIDAIEGKNNYAMKSAMALAKAHDYSATMNRLYWNAERCFYYDIIPNGPGQWKQNLDFTVVGGFWTLWAGVPSQEQLKCMIEKQMVPEAFGGNFPFPANARNSIGKYKDPLYVPRPGDEEDGYWDKWAHWPPMVMMAIEGFRRMGRADLAHEYALDFLKRTAEWSTTTVEESLGETVIRLPDGRIIGFKARAIQHAEHMHRADFAGWGKGPPVYLLLNHILGLRPNNNGKMRWNLMVPLEIGQSIEVKNLQYMGATVRSMKVSRASSGAYELSVDADGNFDIELNLMRDPRGRLVNRPVAQVRGSVKGPTAMVLDTRLKTVAAE